MEKDQEDLAEPCSWPPDEREVLPSNSKCPVSPLFELKMMKGVMHIVHKLRASKLPCYILVSVPQDDMLRLGV